LPSYQRRYSGERYPHEIDRQYSIQREHYRYQPRDPVSQRYQMQRRQPGPPQDRGRGNDKH
jgi:hypothetical protein